MISADFVEEVLSNYIKLEEDTLKRIELNEITDKKLSDFEKERLKSIYKGRLELLKDIHYDLLE